MVDFIHNIGLYGSQSILFGLVNAESNFQRGMQIRLQNLFLKRCLVCLCDALF